jgi:hypothetical protein
VAAGCDVAAGCVAEAGWVAAGGDGWSSALDAGEQAIATNAANKPAAHLLRHLVVRFMWFSSPSLPRSHFHLMRSRLRNEKFGNTKYLSPLEWSNSLNLWIESIVLKISLIKSLCRGLEEKEELHPIGHRAG